MMLFKRHKQSLSGKLTMLFVGMTILLIILSSVLIGLAFKQNFHNTLRPHLDQYLEYLLDDLGNPPDINRANKIAKDTSVEIQFHSADKRWSTNTHQLGIINLKDIEFHRRFSENQLKYSFGEYRNHEVLVNKKDNETVVFILPHPGRHFGSQTILHFIVLISVLALFYYATKRIFSPVHTIKDGIKQIGEGDLEFRLNIGRKDELGELARHINTMADDIQSMLDAKRQLLLAISHELRSPLTRAKVATAMLEDPTQQENINRDLQEMETLIEEILETERLSSRHYTLNKTEFDLMATIEDIISVYAEKVVITKHPASPIKIIADQPRIKLLLRNVIDNAVRHTAKDADQVQVQCERDDQDVIITVTDHGEGIAAEHLPHVLEPFYRVDPSRQRESGGYGLGLYLSRVICEAHGGTLRLESVLHQGTSVKMTLPFFSG